MIHQDRVSSATEGEEPNGRKKMELMGRGRGTFIGMDFRGEGIASLNSYFSPFPNPTAFNQDEIQNQALKLPANAHYFCPYCDFMTKTASRFHIHYMQHLNVRPFECSVCRIKSNWLWDINKHIRTRVSQGDTTHRGAKCVCINEAGLRDYNKYRCFIKEVSDEVSMVIGFRLTPCVCGSSD